MKILVCVSKTPETTAKISFEGGKTFDKSNVNFIMNPYDEWYALVRGVELASEHSGTVTILNVGTSENDAIIRKGLAIGANDAVRIDTEPRDSLFVAHQIANFVKSDSFDLVLFGKETIDYNGSEVPAMVAELLDQPFISYATGLKIEGQTATIARDIEGGTEVAKVDLPFVASAAKGMAEQKIPNMRGIMMARKKPLKVVAAVDIEAQTQFSSFELPAEKTECKYVDAENMEELVRLLKSEAKVL